MPKHWPTSSASLRRRSNPVQGQNSQINGNELGLLTHHPGQKAKTYRRYQPTPRLSLRSIASLRISGILRRFARTNTLRGSFERYVSRRTTSSHIARMTMKSGPPQRGLEFEFQTQARSDQVASRKELRYPHHMKHWFQLLLVASSRGSDGQRKNIDMLERDVAELRKSIRAPAKGQETICWHCRMPRRVC